MKITVIEAFFDKSTGEPYNRGDIYEGDKDRVTELRDGGFLALIPAKQAAKADAGGEGAGAAGNAEPGAADGVAADPDGGKAGK
jgi:hypothetical protein